MSALLKFVGWGAAFLLLAAGLYLTFEPIWHGWGQLFFGDDGDGLFNLWVLEDNFRAFAAGSWRQIWDGGIYYPEHAHSKLMSDTLLVPSALYSLLRLMGGSQLAAYNTLVLLLVLLAWVCHWGFFHLVWRLGRGKVLGSAFYPLVPLLATITNFSMGRNLYLVHFQNLSGFWATGVAVCGALFVATRQSRWLAAQLLCFVFVNYSTQYFGVMSFVFLLLTGLVLWWRFGGGELLALAKRNAWLVVAGVALIGPLVWQYGKVVLGGHNPIHVVATLQAFSLVTPIAHSLAFDWAQWLGIPLAGVNHEAVGYLGWGVLVIAIALIVANRKFLSRSCVKIGRSRWFWGFVAVAVAISALRLWRMWLVWPAFLVLVWYVHLSGAFVVRRVRLQLVPLVYLVLAVIAAYGTAFGPSRFFDGLLPNPSLWGVMEFFTPGYIKMRAVGRMAPLGFGLLLMALLWWLLYHLRQQPQHRQRLWLLGALAFFSLAGAEHLARPYVNGPQFNWHPQADERAFFATIDAPVVVFPVQPWHQNTYTMLYFGELGLPVINGYSGRMAGVFDLIMDGSGGGEPSLRQLRTSAVVGVKYGVNWKPRFGQNQPPRQLPAGCQIVFENERFQVFSIPESLGRLAG